MVIKHNLSAMNNARQLSVVCGRAGKSSEKLSSGYRINRAADDAAGLSISEKMRAQIRGLNQASENASDGISLIQTAEGALEEIQSSVHRIRELSVKAANDTCTKEERDYMQLEVDQLITEIDRIADNTEFNSMKLLDGSLSKGSDAFGSRNLSSGSADGPFISVTYEFTTSQTPAGGNTVAGHTQLAQDLETQILPQIVNSILNQYSAFSYLNGSSIGIGLRLYSQSNNTLAYVRSGCSEGGSGGVVGSKEYQLGVNLNSLRFQSDGNLTAQSREELEATIAHEMTHAFMAEATTNGMLGRDRFPLWFVEGMAQTASGPGGWTSSLSAASSDASIRNFLSKIGPGYVSSDSSANYGAGYLANMYLGWLAGSGGSMEARIQDGLNKIMGTIIDGDSLDKAIAQHTRYRGLSDFSNNLKNDTQAYDFVRDLITATGSGRGGLVTGDLTDTDLAADAAPGTGGNLFKLYPRSEKVTNYYSGDYVILKGGGARSSEPPPGSFSTGGLDVIGNGGLLLHVGPRPGEMFKVTIGSARSSDLGLDFLSVGTEESAGWAMDATKLALERVSSIRSSLGACQNGLEHLIANLDNSAENTQAAESLIRDLDMSREMLDYSCNNILMQAGQAVLAQTSRNSQNVLTLIS